MKKLKILCFVSILFVLFGCGTNTTTDPSEKNDINPTNTSTNSVISQDISKQVKENLTTYKDLTNSKSVNTDDTILVVVQVKHLKRLKLAEVRKDIKKILEKEFPLMTIYVSTDQKVNKEIDRIRQQIESNSISNKSLNKSVEDLIQLAKEDT